MEIQSGDERKENNYIVGTYDHPIRDWRKCRRCRSYLRRRHHPLDRQRGHRRNHLCAVREMPIEMTGKINVMLRNV